MHYQNLVEDALTPAPQHSSNRYIEMRQDQLGYPEPLSTEVLISTDQDNESLMTIPECLIQLLDATRLGLPLFSPQNDSPSYEDVLQNTVPTFLHNVLLEEPLSLMVKNPVDPGSQPSWRVNISWIYPYLCLLPNPSACHQLPPLLEDSIRQSIVSTYCLWELRFHSTSVPSPRNVDG